MNKHVPNLITSVRLVAAAAYAIFFSVIAFWICKLPLILPSIALIWAACSLEGMIITTILRAPKTNVSGVLAAYAMATGKQRV